MCTTVGETAADYLNMTLGVGLTNTTYFMTALLIISLVAQFKVRRYVPALYWWVVVVISVVGTLITDNLTDNLGVPLTITTLVFAVLLAGVFWVWHRSERTLSIHSIYTRQREGYYWLAILFTFALGTAAGDLTAEKLQLGYFISLVLFATLIAAVVAAYRYLNINSILAFWMAYVLTRPLGASIGDYLSQSRVDGGLGLGTTMTSYVFLGLILIVVVYLSVTKIDQNRSGKLSPETE